MARKGENIYKRKDGRWEGRYISSRTTTGKAKYSSIYGKKYEDVKRKLLQKKVEQISDFTISKRTIKAEKYSEWLAYWIDKIEKKRVKKTTLSIYSRLVEVYINPSIGDLLLNEISSKKIDKFLEELQEKDLAPGTVRNIFNVVKKSLVDAYQQGYIREFPCKSVQLPKLIKHEVNTLTLAQQKKLECTALKETSCSAIIIALYSGMRIGEISGLQWRDIDFDEDMIYIRRTVSRIFSLDSVQTKTELTVGSPKSASSIRKIPIAKNLKNYLQEKRKNATSEYVIESSKELTEPRTITNRFKRILVETNLENINFHTLRHTFATRCLEQGMDIASLSKILGHQSTKMTLDTYAGSLMETRRKGISQLDTLLEIV
ncbi:tyrosine-type recombinase/integrase [Enterococcus sp. HY326]|uniref:tyrosine-type recombinase/integrase n=1 Tax=Enterococcus sp. HY326 TaxID=2971265 RepID=UPI0022400C46|nr:site-specific integrase [Enterococcus sp. HY326]